MGAKRNKVLYGLLTEIRKHPNDDDLRGDWAVAASDLVRAVRVTQFASMKNSPDSDDLEQAALVEFHRSAKKFAKMTSKPDMNETRMFRILYSVARFSMIREYARIKKHAFFPQYGSTTEDEESHQEIIDPETFYDGDDALSAHSEGECAGEVFKFTDFEKDFFIRDCLPQELMRIIEEKNVYRDTKFSGAIFYCVYQLLRGRTCSVSLITSWWGFPSPRLIEDYAKHVIKLAVLTLGDSRSTSNAVIT